MPAQHYRLIMTVDSTGTLPRCVLTAPSELGNPTPRSMMSGVLVRFMAGDH